MSSSRSQLIEWVDPRTKERYQYDRATGSCYRLRSDGTWVVTKKIPAFDGEAAPRSSQLSGPSTSNTSALVPSDRGNNYVLSSGMERLSMSQANTSNEPASGQWTLRRPSLTASEPARDIKYISSQSAQPPPNYSSSSRPPYVSSATWGGPSTQSSSKNSRPVDLGPIVKDGHDPETGVRSRVVQHPPEALTDESLRQRNIVAQKALVPPPGPEEAAEALNPQYRLRKKAKKFFIVGKVFQILWAEPAGENTLITSTEALVGRYGERVFSKVRRFVVVRESDKFCSALPILTYGSQGTAAQKVKNEDHGVIFTGRIAPIPLQGEGGMQPEPIRVLPDDPKDTLSSLSRINYGTVFTVHHNIKVRPFGVIHPNSERDLISQFYNVWVPGIGVKAGGKSIATSGLASIAESSGAAASFANSERMEKIKEHSKAVQHLAKSHRSRGKSVVRVPQSRKSIRDSQEEEESEHDNHDDESEQHSSSSDERTHPEILQHRPDSMRKWVKDNYAILLLHYRKRTDTEEEAVRLAKEKIAQLASMRMAQTSQTEQLANAAHHLNDDHDDIASASSAPSAAADPRIEAAIQKIIETRGCTREEATNILVTAFAKKGKARQEDDGSDENDEEDESSSEEEDRHRRKQKSRRHGKR